MKENILMKKEIVISLILPVVFWGIYYLLYLIGIMAKEHDLELLDKIDFWVVLIYWIFMSVAMPIMYIIQIKRILKLYNWTWKLLVVYILYMPIVLAPLFLSLFIRN
ncbi:MAG TPA: hypothetical protein PLB12_03760 [Candidatus Goldiibacteriota bacterium]|nr:hypothetical protein [Candidatus Goldiibacteriota bacterium]HPN63759.1 hypothetical protein [Candidatus Goldiibacteriota bacterium]HRQ43443.1 hypothetical protein [Candidatus Goldiibacteriota bacterium]